MKSSRKVATASLTVNGLSVEWSEDSRRKLLPCRRCGEPTHGRATDSHDDERRPRSYTACMNCALDAPFQQMAAMVRGVKEVLS